MKRLLLSILTSVVMCSGVVQAQTQVKTADIPNLYKTTSFTGISVHDPSVVWDSKSQQFYIFGSHYWGGKSKDLRNWTGVGRYYEGAYDSGNAYKAFKKNPTRKVKRVLPGKTEVEEVNFPSFDASAYASTFASIKVDDRAPVSEAQWVSGCQWAPDIVWNPTMNKWCYYVSINGDYWASVVVLMTSDNIEGPYTYQGPVVFGGFTGKSYSGVKADYKKTDLEIVLGPQSSLPGRYNTSSVNNGTYWPNPIDPCVFFDEEGELWCAYGSWSGGIFMLKLDKETGLRDYTYTYSGTGSTLNADVTSDAYYGIRIAGGWYVSGEGPYIQHIGDYYYLFMSYGGFAPDGGYEMRVFRSEKPTGPYVDAAGQTATYTGRYVLNYGPRAATNKGMKLIGAMNKWGKMKTGETAQGHNSACVDPKGRSFLVCHTKFNNGTLGHSVRSYQMYLNKQGWLCCAPFQFAGETTTDADIASKQPWSAAQVEGDYHLLIHPYKLDHGNMAEATPVNIHLSADGKVTGDKTGTWKYTDAGKSYVQITVGGVTYSGVVVEQTLENNSAKTLCFTAVCCSGTKVGEVAWAYKLQPQSAIALNYQQNSAKLKATYVSTITSNKELLFDTDENVTLTWTSSEPDVVSGTGKYNPRNEAVSLTLSPRLECGDYYWTDSFSAKASAAKAVEGDPFSGIVAYYNFDVKSCANAYDASQVVTTSSSNTSTTKAPAYEVDNARFGQVLHQNQGAQKYNSYAKIINPLKDAADIDGFTVSMWVNRTDDNKWDALWSFFNSTISSAAGPRLFFTGNCYLGFNDNNGNWFDVNNPEKKEVNVITPGEWVLVTVTFSKDNGYTIYKNITKQFVTNYQGSTAKIDDFDKQLVLNHVTSSNYFLLGLGSFWGSADAKFDDLIIYNRCLSAEDVRGLNTVLNRVNDLTPEGVNAITAIESVTIDSEHSDVRTDNAQQHVIYDLQGRKVANPQKGIYIVDGKKVQF